jgi:phosphoribosylformylglycinamidine cyclo-ligase
MCVNDVLVTGGEPFLFLDYFATGKLQVDQAATVIEGIAAACELAGCTLAGGETAEMPGFYSDGDYDLAGFCVGIVEEAKVITGAAIAPGHQLLALPSSGPHSNGFSLIRRILAANPGCLDAAPERLAQLLEPTAIYVKTILGLLKAGHPIDGMAHITGGGLPENLPRMLPKNSDVPLALAVDLASWTWPEPFPWLATLGNVAPLEMMKTFNCGVGFVLAVAAEATEGVEAALATAGQPCWRLGAVVDGREAAMPGTLHITAEGEGTLA